MELDVKKHYPKDWVVLQNRVVECFKSMTLDEKRLFIMATPLARTTNISSGEPIFISTEEFASACGLEITGAYTALGIATKKLFDRYFGYVRADKKKVSIRWMYKTAYGEGGAELYFTDEVLLLLREFDALNPYTKYKKEVVLRLKKDYSLDFYHLAKKHQKMGGFQISLDELFEQLGLPESYQDLSNLKKRVIKPSLDEITANTDIDLSYENIKRGRSVVGFKFTVKEKTKDKAITSQKKTEAKPNQSEKDKKNNLAWGTSENHLFKQLQQKCPGLNKGYVEELAHKGSHDLSFVLNDMFMKHAKSDSFELELTD
jgi:plasmid replication initiation protein